MEEKQTSNLERTNKILTALVIILSILLGVVLWQFFELRKTNAQKGTEIELLGDERGDLQNELEDMLTEMDSLETDNDSMKVQLAQRREEVEDLLHKVKDKDFAIYKLRKETKTLRVIMKGYVVTIDSINTLNVGLRNENKAVKQTLYKERTKAKELQKSNENLSSKVALASRLDVRNVSVVAIRLKKDMTGKETDRAKKASKLRVCFSLDENRVAKAEKKKLYIRIIAPDGKVLKAGSSDEYKFSFNGVRGYFSDKLLVDYSNKAADYCLDWEKPSADFDLPIGEYKVFLFAEDYEMASTSHILK